MDDWQLVELIRERPCLYNPKYPRYKDVNVRDDVWMEIAGLMRQPVEECKYRWKNIRDTFMRRKRNKLLKGASRTRKSRKWSLETHLEFLDQIEYQRELSTDVTTTDTEADVKYENNQTEAGGIVVGAITEASETSADASSVDADINEASAERQVEQSYGIDQQSTDRRKQTTTRSMDNVTEFFITNPAQRSKLLSSVVGKGTEESEIDTFFKSMAISVKKLSPANQIRAKIQICNIVGQLELDEISSANSGASVSTNYDRHMPRLTSVSAAPDTASACQSDNKLQFMTNVSGHNVD
ncbi:transcription factor Adf-1-like [Schistocerca nitens]|uniref:transcription factor Adf-1-like n=1 Tax=Schistocerca nitens TaxID=7011 RepID=UPI0021178FAA|nr:transcription factor Adf-1-like [Schistocerca nitens]